MSHEISARALRRSWGGYALLLVLVILSGNSCRPTFGTRPGVEYLGREGVVFQRADNDCAVASLAMVFCRFGISRDYMQLWNRLSIGAAGTDMQSMMRIARAEGLLCEGWRLAARDLSEIPLPAILLLRRSHFVVLEGVGVERAVLILDPMRGRLRMTLPALLSGWTGEILLFGRPGPRPGRLSRWFPSGS